MYAVLNEVLGTLTLTYQNFRYTMRVFKIDCHIVDKTFPIADNDAFLLPARGCRSLTTAI